MSDWPVTVVRAIPRQTILSMASPIAGSSRDLYESSASAVYPAANRALYYPMILDTPVTVTQMFAYNGATAAGKLDLGIYDEAFNRLVNKGLTTQEGTSTLQLLNITDTLLLPGLYYWAMTATLGTATYFRGTSSAARQRMTGVKQQALGSELELPATATPAAPESSYIPVFGASISSAAVV